MPRRARNTKSKKTARAYDHKETEAVLLAARRSSSSPEKHPNKREKTSAMESTRQREKRRIPGPTGRRGPDFARLLS